MKFILIGKVSVRKGGVVGFYPHPSRSGFTTLLLEGGHAIDVAVPAHEVRDILTKETK